MEIFTKAVSLILSLSILVVLHELGHFIPAKLFKTKVEKFYLFFDPWFSLVKKKIGETTYGIGWLPLGGYVKIAGMVDESMDKEAMAEPAKPWEFRSKPAWQRLIIMIGGVTVNIVLAFIIYSMILFTWGKDILPAKNVDGVAVATPIKAFGFRDGDHLKAMDGVEPALFHDFTGGILLDGVQNVTVTRATGDTTITITEELVKTAITLKGAIFSQLFPFKVKEFTETSKNVKSGLLAGDMIQGINGKEIKYFQYFSKEIKSHKCSRVVLNVNRDGEALEINASVDKNGYIGVVPVGPTEFLTYEKKEYTFLESIPAGISEAIGTLGNYVKQFKLVFTKEGAEGLGGFGALGGLFPDSFDDENYWLIFWERTALLSVILAFMNILPIPALDGGHVMFLLYEMIARRKPGEKFMEYAQITGMVLLFGLMIFANGNDVFKLFTGEDDPQDCVEQVDTTPAATTQTD